MATTQTITAAPGYDLYRLAARVYGDPTGWTLIARANGLTDPIVQKMGNLIIPPYNAQFTQGGILGQLPAWADQVIS